MVLCRLSTAVRNGWRVCQQWLWLLSGSFFAFFVTQRFSKMKECSGRHLQNASGSTGKHLFIGITLMSLNPHSQKTSNVKAETIRLQIEMCFQL